LYNSKYSKLDVAALKKMQHSDILIPNVAEKYILIMVEEKKII
jgi:hypothetical protein